jgi:predicted  nucleic acid-binding Zn-ribbon protein
VIFDTESSGPRTELHPEESLPVVKRSDESTKALRELVRLYEETQSIVQRKEETIQDLSYKLGKVETEMKNMVPLVEYNKATFMLESAKSRHDSDALVYTEKLANLEKEVTKRNAAIISLALLFVLVLGFSIVFLFYTRLL